MDERAFELGKEKKRGMAVTNKRLGAVTYCLDATLIFVKRRTGLLALYYVDTTTNLNIPCCPIMFRLYSDISHVISSMTRGPLNVELGGSICFFRPEFFAKYEGEIILVIGKFRTAML